MTGPKKRAGPVQDERGVEIVEFIGMMPILLWVGLIVWQFMVFGHCMLVTAAAARDGASHIVVGRPILEADDPAAAAQSILDELAEAAGS